MERDTFILTLILAALVAWHWIRIAWIFPRALRRAEVLMDGGGLASEAADILHPARFATGELGYRAHLLMGRAHFSLGFRNQAWGDFLVAQFVRMPIWKRILTQPFFRKLAPKPGPWSFRYGRFLLKLAPQLPHLHHRLGVLYLRRGAPGDTERAWEHFRTLLPLAAEDPMLLEDLLLAALNRGEQEMAHQALTLLMQRHADPRLPWDRTAPSNNLLRLGLAADALALQRSLPPAFRTDPKPWSTEARALRQLGDGAGAWASVEAGLERFPNSFRLWMDRHLLAMDSHHFEEARHCLQQAKPALASTPGEGSVSDLAEWNLRSAEFVFWIDGDGRAAWNFLRVVPPEHRGQRMPPLELELQVAMGDFTDALARCKALLAETPGDPGLLLLEGECLAGLAAWEPLLDFLEGLGEAPRQHASFWHLRGLALAHRGDSLNSRMDLERAATMEPVHLRLVLDAGHACADLGEWERSENHWRQALRLDQACEEALVHLAESRSALHDDEGARRYLRECLTHHPESTEAHTRLAELESN